MFGSETLEVAIGLAVLFSFMSLFASAARETIEALQKDRAQLVHRALEELFSEKGKVDDGTLKRFYESIVISPLFRGAYKKLEGDLPSYISAGDFSTAVVELAREDAKVPPGTPIAQWADKLGDTQVSKLVRLAFTSTGNDPDKARAFIETWFNGQMDRVSGWYKRKTHWWLLLIGFVSALALNVDAIAITKHFYRNDALRELIVAHAQSRPPADAAAPAATAPPDAAHGQAEASRVAGELRDYGFPMGWSWEGKWPAPDAQCSLVGGGASRSDCTLATIGLAAILLMVIGWIITALAISLGAPFWFDILNKFMVVRSTVKPAEKSPPEASKDPQPSAPAPKPRQSGA